MITRPSGPFSGSAVGYSCINWHSHLLLNWQGCMMLNLLLAPWVAIPQFGIFFAWASRVTMVFHPSATYKYLNFALHIWILKWKFASFCKYQNFKGDKAPALVMPRDTYPPGSLSGDAILWAGVPHWKNSLSKAKSDIWFRVGEGVKKVWAEEAFTPVKSSKTPIKDTKRHR